MPLSRMLKLAVVTPVYQTPTEQLTACRDSVRAQVSAADLRHFLILDGEERPDLQADDKTLVIRMPGPHRDYGDTARGFGAMLAAKQGADAIAFLDADNWLLPGHLASLLELHEQTKAAVCTSSRMLFGEDADEKQPPRELGPCFETDGKTFVDTNCYLIFRPAFKLLAQWLKIPEHLHVVGDRVFWSHVKKSGATHAHCGRPTVAYRTRWKCHFDHFGVTPPADAKETVDLDQVIEQARAKQSGFEGERGTLVPRGNLEQPFGQNSPTFPRGTDVPRSPRRRVKPPCVILVPVGGSIEPACEEPLRTLERRGYEVRRIRGYSAIDQGRCQMATDAMSDGFEETLWIDSDVGFHPNDVERLRRNEVPLCCGIYPKKGKRELASHALPGATKMVFGKEGGLTEILYAATGFLHVRREVYETMQRVLELPVCNLRFGRPLVPYFQPLTITDHLAPESKSQPNYWYLAEDFAFSERARRSGFKIFADTRIRLFHYGGYGYSWEEAGHDQRRYQTFTYHLQAKDSPAEKRD